MTLSAISGAGLTETALRAVLGRYDLHSEEGGPLTLGSTAPGGLHAVLHKEGGFVTL